MDVRILRVHLPGEAEEVEEESEPHWNETVSDRERDPECAFQDFRAEPERDETSSCSCCGVAVEEWNGCLSLVWSPKETVELERKVDYLAKETS